MIINFNDNKEDIFDRLKNLRERVETHDYEFFNREYFSLLEVLSNLEFSDDKTIFNLETQRLSEIERELFSLKVEKTYFDLFNEEISKEYKYRIGDLK